jgi:RNA polymerase sigma factor (sigma-70 family)
MRQNLVSNYRVVALDDLEGAAVDGLICAANSYNLSTTVPFWGYAQRRVWGAMQDMCRDRGHLRRKLLFDAVSLSDIPENDDDAFWADSAGRDPRAARPLRASWQYPSVAPVEPFAGTLLHKIMNRAMMKLIPADRRVLAMVYRTGMRQADVARVLGVLDCRITQRHKRALGTLKKELSLAGITSL